jgi:hypothetical protein
LVADEEVIGPVRVMFPPADLDLIVTPCKSCRRPVIWCLTESGRLMPVDADRSHTGNLLVFELLSPPDKPYPRVKVAQDVEREYFAQWDLWVSHFATCPKAAQHRRPRR